MKKLIKYSLFSVIGLIVVLFLALAILITVVNPNRFKPLIVKAVYDATSRQISLAGDIHWKLYPNLGVTLNQVSLANPAGFSQADFLKFNSADVSVALLPLLQHKVIVKTLAIDGLEVALLKQNGKNNWTFSSVAPESSPSMAPQEQPKPLQLEMSAFSFTNAKLSYDDFDAGKHYALNKANLIVSTGFGGIIRFDQAAELLELNKVSLKFNDQVVADFSAKISNFTNPQYSANFAISTLQLNALLDQFKIAEATRKNMHLIDNLSLNGRISGESDNVTLSEFNFNLNNQLKGKTNLVLTNFAKPNYHGDLNLESFNLNQVLDGLNIAVATRKDKPLLNNFALSLAGFKGNLDALNVNGLKAVVGNALMVSLNQLNVSNFANPSISGDINLANFNLNKVLDGLNIAVATRKDKPLLNNFAFSAKSFVASKTSLNLKQNQISVGNLLNASLANVQINDFTNPSISGDVNLPSFNLNQVLDGLNIAVATRKDKPLLNKFALKTNFTTSLNNANLLNTQLALGNELHLSLAKLQVQDFKNPKINGNVSIPTFSLNNVMQQLGMNAPKIANKKILDKVALNTDFSASMNSFAVSGLSLHLANSTLSGNLALNSFKPLIINHNILIDQLDVADFSNLLGYKVPLRQLRLIGNAKIASDLNMASLNSKEQVQIGNITLEGLSVDKLILRLNSIINKAGQGNSDALHIALNSLELTQAINKMKAELAEVSKPGVRDFSQKTNLGSFSGNATIVNGLVNPSDFKLNVPSVSLSGHGSVNLVNKALTYKTSSQLLVNGVNPIFKKLSFNSTISGTMDNPSASLDWGLLQQQLLKYLVENNKQQIQGAVKQQINQAVGEQVKQAIGNKGADQVIDKVSKGVADTLGKLFGN